MHTDFVIGLLCVHNPHAEFHILLDLPWGVDILFSATNCGKRKYFRLIKVYSRLIF